MDVKTVWKGKMSFTGVSESGFQIPLDALPDHGGDNSGPRPMELIAIGLAGCTAMDVISILQKKRQQVSQFEVRVHADRAEEHPRVFTKAIIEYIITGSEIDSNAVERAMELSRDRYCPAQSMLGKAFPIELVYTIHNE